ncbi:MAG: pyridoxamine 5'-phosphate oxidase family protein [Actinomycetia bacterium]|nr:pyridoxamine 5'-phosphate oxidase family protein [Actinomycetes bacterium]
MLNEHPAVRTRLHDEPIAWLTTVTASGRPSTAPVWFYLEDDDTITIYSRDPSVRVRSLAGNSKVTLHLEGNGMGGAIVVLNGDAVVDKQMKGVASHTAYVAKYQKFLEGNSWTPEWFEENYPAPIRMTINSIVG